MAERWEYHTNPIKITDAEHVKRVLNMAAEDGWELHTILALPHPENAHDTGLIIWRRLISN